jgi:hypothetical protein
MELPIAIASCAFLLATLSVVIVQRASRAFDRKYHIGGE